MQSEWRVSKYVTYQIKLKEWRDHKWRRTIDRVLDEVARQASHVTSREGRAESHDQRRGRSAGRSCEAG